MSEKRLIARPETVRAAIDANKTTRKTLVRYTRGFGFEFVQAHDDNLAMLRQLLVRQW